MGMMSWSDQFMVALLLLSGRSWRHFSSSIRWVFLDLLPLFYVVLLCALQHSIEHRLASLRSPRELTTEPRNSLETCLMDQHEPTGNQGDDSGGVVKGSHGDGSSAVATASQGYDSGAVVTDSQGYDSGTVVAHSQDDDSCAVVTEYQGDDSGTVVTASQGDDSGVVVTGSHGDDSGTVVICSHGNGSGAAVKVSQGDESGAVVTGSQDGDSGVVVTGSQNGDSGVVVTGSQGDDSGAVVTDCHGGDSGAVMTGSPGDFSVAEKGPDLDALLQMFQVLYRHHGGMLARKDQQSKAQCDLSGKHILNFILLGDIIQNAYEDEGTSLDDSMGSRSAQDFYALRTDVKVGAEKENYVACQVQRVDVYSAECAPLDGTRDIQLRGRKQCGPTFVGDEVLVKMMPSKSRDRLGKVVALTKTEPRDGKCFLCQVDKEQSHIMLPLCKTAPKFHVLHNESRIYLYDVKRGKLVRRGSVYIDTKAREELFFVITYLKWELRYVYPLGFVRAVVKRPSKLTKKDLLRIQDIIFRAPLGEFTIPDSNQTHTADGRLDLRSMTIFTIDPQECRICEDGFSLEKAEEDYFKLGIHIPDVVAFVPKAGHVDIEAMKQATRFRVSGVWGKLAQLCSLAPGKERLALSVFVKIDRSGIRKAEPAVIEETLVCSERHLTLTEAQDIIASPVVCRGTLESKVKDCMEIAVRLREKRLKKSYFFFDGQNDTQDAINLVEELMILANLAVQEFLQSDPSVSHYPVRSQPLPEEDDLNDWANRSGIWPSAFYFNRYRNTHLRNHFPVQPSHVPMLLPVASDIARSLESRRHHRAAQIIGSEKRHPFHRVAISAWHTIQKRPRYSCFDKEKANIVHCQHNTENYVQFTSPLMRFNDIVVHRLVKASLRQQPMPYSADELRHICRNISLRVQKRKEHRRACALIGDLGSLIDSPRVENGIIHSISEGEIAITLPWDPVEGEECLIKYCDLGLTGSPKLEDNTVTLNWTLRLYDTQPQKYARTNSNALQPSTLVHRRNTVDLTRQEWSDMQDFVTSRHHTGSTEDDTQLCKELLQLVRSKLGDTAAPAVTSEMRPNEPWRYQYCKAKKTLQVGQAVPVQIHASVSFHQLIPRVTAVEVSKELQLCVEHHKDPVKCFADKATMMTSNRYDDVKAYKQVMLPLMEMEAVTSMVREADIVSVNNCPCDLTKRNGRWEGSIILSHAFIKDRALSFVNKAGKPAINYLCLKYPFSDASKKYCLWQAHAVVDKAGMITHEDGTEWALATFIIRQQHQAPPKRKLSISVDFFTKSAPSSMMEEAVNKLHKASEVIQSLALGNIETTKKSDEQLECFPPDLDIPNLPLPNNNTLQKHALKRALQQDLTLIQGPPGTGKTLTAAKLVYWFCQKNRARMTGRALKGQVLYCGPSNACIDVATRFMLSRFAGACPKLTRVYNADVVNAAYPVPRDVSAMRARDTTHYKVHPELDRIALHHRVRQPANPHSARLKEFDRIFKRNKKTPEKVSDREIEDYYKVLDIAYKEELTGERTDVIICTCTMSGTSKVKSCNIVQCIIDESGMCLEAETLIPLVATEPDQIVLIGDQKQLQPIVINKDAKRLGLNRSLFERHSESAIMLKEQYRMHPDICVFPSKQFYNGELVTPMHERWPVAVTPTIAFCHVEGVEKQQAVFSVDGNVKSTMNETEIHHVVRLYQEFVGESDSVAVLSQYRSQCAGIKRRLGPDNPNVKTAVTAQGGEWDYVILSTVRSLPKDEIEENPSRGWCHQYIGFITDEHQINVALTRARKGLVILGNKHLLQCDPTWNTLIQHYELKGALMNVADFRANQILSLYSTSKK